MFKLEVTERFDQTANNRIIII